MAINCDYCETITTECLLKSFGCHEQVWSLFQIDFQYIMSVSYLDSLFRAP